MSPISNNCYTNDNYSYYEIIHITSHVIIFIFEQKQLVQMPFNVLLSFKQSLIIAK